MKYLIIATLLAIACRTSSLDSKIRNDFEEDVRTNWSCPTKENKFNFASDTLLINLKSKYRELILGKDTGYINKLFGKSYSLLAGGCNDTTNWRARKLGLEYNVHTAAVDGSNKYKCGYIFNVCTDTLGVIRWLDVYTYDCVGQE